MRIINYIIFMSRRIYSLIVMIREDCSNEKHFNIGYVLQPGAISKARANVKR